MSDVVVHHLENSRSHRAAWMLEELGVNYTIRRYARNPKTMRAPKELEEVHPLGKAPVVTVDGEVLAESGAILEELVDRFGEGRFRPSEGEALRRYRYFLHYGEGSLMPPLLVKLILGQIRKAPVPFFIKPITKQIAGAVDKNFAGPEVVKHRAFLESELADRDWFAGEAFTAADVQMSFPVEALASRSDLAAFPHLGAWLTRIHQREGYKRALEKTGPNEILG